MKCCVSQRCSPKKNKVFDCIRYIKIVIYVCIDFKETANILFFHETLVKLKKDEYIKW